MPGTAETEASSDLARSDPAAPTQLDPVVGGEESTLLAPPTGLIGTTLDDRYYVEKELGRGGIGAVYLARDRKLVDQAVVVKILLEKSLQSEWVMRKFQHEKEALAILDHPGIVRVTDSGKLPNGMPYLVMQYVEGKDLRAYIRPEGADLEWTASVVEQIGLALQAAHDNGVLHRDLKPENVMIQTVAGGRTHVKVIDFGIAKVRDSKLASSTTVAGTAGTIAYMSPEQLRADRLTPASDIYALGLLAYELVTGRRPFNPETIFQLLDMQRGGVRVKPHDLRPALPKAAQNVILRALAYDPAARYQSAADFAEDFALAMRNDPVLRRPVVDPGAETVSDPGPNDHDSFQEAVIWHQLNNPPTMASRTSYSELPQYLPPPASRSRSGYRSILLATAALVVVSLIGLGTWRYLRTSTPPVNNPPGTNPNTPGPEQRLNYWLTVQKMRDGKPYQAPYETSGDEGLETDYEFQVNVASPNAGYLYLLNEGPDDDGAISYVMLYPKPDINNGSAALPAGQTMKTPGAYVLDPNTGVENFWLVWSTKPVPELEATKGAVNPTDKGTVKDPAQAGAVRQFLTKYDGVAKTVTKDPNGRRATVKGHGDVLVNRMALKHN
jgi:serine/threonine protein kinase